MNAFWGAAISHEQPYTLHPENPPRRLRITQATITSRYDVWRTRSVVQCSVGGRPPVYICALHQNSILLDFEIEESQDVVFSVVGPRGVHLSGYFLPHTNTTQVDIDDTQIHIHEQKSQTETRPSHSIGAIANEGFIYDKRRINCPSSSKIDKDINCPNHVDKSTNDARNDAVAHIDEMVGNEDTNNQIVAVFQQENLANSIISDSTEYQGVVPNSDESRRDHQTSEFPMPLTIVWPVDTLNPILKNSQLTMKKLSVDDRAIMICPNPSEIGGMVDDLDNDKDMGCNHDSISHVSQQHFIAFETANDVRKDKAIAHCDEMDDNEDGYYNTVAVVQNEDVKLTNNIISIAREYEVIVPDSDDGSYANDCHHQFSVPSTILNLTHGWSMKEGRELPKLKFTEETSCDSVIFPTESRSDNHVCDPVMSSIEFGPRDAGELKNEKRKKKTEPIGCRKAEASDADQNLSASMTHDQDYDDSMPSIVLEAGCSGQREKKKSKRRNKESKIIGENAGEIQNQVIKSSLFKEKGKLEKGKVELGRTTTHDKLLDVFVPSIVIEAECCEKLEKKKSKRWHKDVKIIEDKFQENENQDKENGMLLEEESDRCTAEKVIADEHLECSGQQKKKKSKKRNEVSKILEEDVEEIHNQVTKTSLFKEMEKLEDEKVELDRITTHDKFQDVFVPSTAIEAGCENMEKKKSKRRHESKIIDDNVQENVNQVKDNGMRLEDEDDRCTNENVIADEHLQCSDQREKKKSKRRTKGSKIIQENVGEIHNQVFVPSPAIEAGCCEKMEKKRSKRRRKESKIIEDNFQENENQDKDNGMRLEDKNDRCIDENVIADVHMENILDDNRQGIDSSVLDEKRKQQKRKVEETSSTMHDQFHDVSMPFVVYDAGYSGKLKNKSREEYKGSKSTEDRVTDSQCDIRHKDDYDRQDTDSTLKEKRKLKKRKVDESGVREKSIEIDNGSRNILHSQSTLSELSSKRQKNHRQLTISSVFEEKESLKEKKVGEGRIHKKSLGNDICSQKIVLSMCKL